MRDSDGADTCGVTTKRCVEVFASPATANLRLREIMASRELCKRDGVRVMRVDFAALYRDCRNSGLDIRLSASDDNGDIFFIFEAKERPCADVRAYMERVLRL